MPLVNIVALSDQIQKLHIEKMSAAVLRDHLALFKDKAIELEKQIASLQSENMILKSENAQFKSKLDKLKKESDELKTKIQSADKPAHISHALPDAQVKILQFLATLKGNQMYPLESIMSDCGLSEQEAQYHLQELEDDCMIVSADIGSIRVWEIDHDGRGYLIEHNLLS